ncbi:MAG TPA: glycosyltransferase family 4 protein [Candidatus Eisenbacteria bacterium]|nr:glycosyltransferase family 4 protein [Candidatus Eisenbacteria bacterium]
MSLRVLVTTDTVGGVWTFAMELASTLSRAGFDIELATMGGPVSGSQRAQAERIPRLRLHESLYRLEWMEESWLSVTEAGEWLLDLERRLAPDLIHLNGYVHAALPWRAPVVVTAHSCVLSWCRAVHGDVALPAWDRYADEVRRGVQAARILAAPTRAMLDEIAIHYGEPAEGRVIPNGRTPHGFTSGTKGRRILTVGRVWDEAKNILALDRVASDLDWPVLVAGSRRHPDGGTVALRAAKSRGVLGPEELASAYASASIFALPALYEPFGYAPLEAALSGCALVLGDIPSLREVWGDAACFVPPRDERALLHALRRLIAEPRVRKEYARRARARAMEYTPERMTIGYMEAYRDALEDPLELLGVRA